MQSHLGLDGVELHKILICKQRLEGCFSQRIQRQRLHRSTSHPVSGSMQQDMWKLAEAFWVSSCNCCWQLNT